MKKIIRTSTVPLTLNTFCSGLLAELSEDYEVVALSSPGKDLEVLAQHDGIRAIAVSMERHISPWKDMVSLWRIAQVFRKEKPDMVHSMTPKAGLLCMMAAKISGVPLRVHTFTGLVFPTATGWFRRLLMFTDQITCACATHIIPEGEGVKNDLQHFGITRKPLQVLGYGNMRGIDLQHYHCTQEVMDEASNIRRLLGILKNDFTFIFVGRLAGDKGINELVRAFCKVCSLHKNIHLILVGEEEKDLDPLEESTRQQIETTENIHSAGWQEDVRPWYAASDALVFPSHREGFPNVVIEAGAMELPSIVTDINGSREIIRDGENGKIIPRYDETALFSAMTSFLEEVEKTKEMASKARPFVASRFEQGYVRQCLKDYYSSLFHLPNKRVVV